MQIDIFQISIWIYDFIVIHDTQTVKHNVKITEDKNSLTKEIVRIESS